MVTPYWISEQFRTTGFSRDFEKRGIVGFIRSSPVYKQLYCSNISNAYFDGIFPTSYETDFIELAKIKDSKPNSIVSCILNRQLPKVSKEQYQKSILDVLLAYVHSPLQTRKARVPMKNIAAQKAFEHLIARLPLFFFVQKVCVGSHPNRLLVSINFHNSSN